MNKIINYKILFFTVVSMMSINCYAQNIAVARKFYDKAQTSYVNKDYEKATLLIEKSEKYIGGKINSDFAYLKGKILLKSSINVKEVKNIFNLFIEITPLDDFRVNEAKRIIKDLETSNLIDTDGNFKDIVGRFGMYYEYFENKSLKTVIEYNLKGEGISIKKYFENGKLRVDQPKDGDYKIYYPSGNILSQGKVDNTSKQGYNKILYDTNSKAVKDNKPIKVFLSRRSLDLNNYSEVYTEFLNTSKNLDIILFEGFSEFNLNDFDIIIWNSCDTYSYNRLLFDNLDDLLKKGKNIILTGTKKCFGRTISTESYRHYYSNEAVTDNVAKYGIKIRDKIKSSNTINIKENIFFNSEFSFLANNYSTIEISSKKDNREAKYSKLICFDNDDEGIIALYTKKKIKGKLFVHSLNKEFLQGINNGSKVFEYIAKIYYNN